MGRQFAYLSNDKSLTDLALGACGDSLTLDDGKPVDGWGVGYFTDERPLVRKRPTRLDGPVDMRQFVDDVRSNCVVGHLRRGTGASPTPANTQPFRFRSWLFTHVGQAADNPTVSAALRETLPDFLRRNLRGDSDSEVALHVFFDHLRKHAKLEHAIVPPDVLFAAARATLADIDRVNRDNDAAQPPTLDLLFTSGRVLVATNHSRSTLAYMTLDGIDRVEQPLFAGHQGKTTEHAHFKSVIVTWDPNGTDGDWTTVEPGHLLAVDEKFEVHVAPIAAA